MIPWHWLVRAKRWVQNPPSRNRIILFLATLTISLAIAGIEWMGWWPEALTSERPGRIWR